MDDYNVGCCWTGDEEEPVENGGAPQCRMPGPGVQVGVVG